MNRVLDTTKKLVWGLAGLSITSCLLRNDYNVIFSFLILIILNNFYNQNPKLFTKIIIQIFIALIVADVVWLFIMIPTWTHLTNDKSDYWKSLSGMHTFVIVFAFFELILKGLITAYLVYDYNQKNPQELNDLIRLTYLQNMSTPSTKSTGRSNFEEQKNQGARIGGGDSDFKNPY